MKPDAEYYSSKYYDLICVVVLVVCLPYAGHFSRDLQELIKITAVRANRTSCAFFIFLSFLS